MVTLARRADPESIRYGGASRCRLAYFDHDLAHGRAAIEQLERIGQLTKAVLDGCLSLRLSLGGRSYVRMRKLPGGRAPFLGGVVQA